MSITARHTQRLAGVFVVALVMGLLPGFFSPALAATTWVVDSNTIGTPSDCAGTPNVTHNSVAAAVTASGNGDTVLVCPGTFVEPQIRVVVDDLTIQGEGAGVSIIQRPGATSYGIHAVGDSVAFGPAYTDAAAPGGADGLVLRDFTMDGQRTSNADRAFGIKVDPGADDGEIDGVEVKDFYRTGVDFNTADNWYVHDSSSQEAVTGNGFQSTDGTNITYENITATNNGWGGVGVFTRGQFSGTPNTSGIVFTGTNVLEALDKNADIYLEGFDEFDQANPVPITYSTDPLDGAEVTVQSSEVLYAYEGVFYDGNGPAAPNHYYSALYSELSEAQDAATPPRWKDLDPGTVRNIETGQFYPPEPGDPVEVPPGGTVTTDDGSGEPTAGNPQTTSVTVPNGGEVTIEETSTHDQAAPGNDYTFFGDQVNITVDPEPNPNPNPLVLEFKFDASIINPPDPASVQVRRSGVDVPPCDAGNGTSAIPDPCVESQAVDGNGDLVIVVYTQFASPWDFIQPLAACTITGTPGDDFLVGTPGFDVICGLAGDDIIIGKGGGDELHGQEDDDTLYGNAGSDLMFGGDGDDDFFGGPGGDEMYGGLGTDRMWGGLGDEMMFGGFGNDLLVGRHGADYLEGSDGDDTMIGGDGNDVYEGGDGNDDIYAGLGADEIDGGDGANNLRGGGGDDFITATTNGVDLSSDDQFVLAGNGNNEVVLGDGNNYVDAGLGTDEITTGDGNDAVFGGHGNNLIFVGEGDNYVLTGTGPDEVESGSGNDKIETGLGDDYVDAGDGDNAVYAGDGFNEVHTGSGNDYVLGGPSVDWIDTGDGNDRIDGEQGDNIIFSGAGTDSIFTGNGNNYIDSGADVDYVFTGLGADEIHAGAGDDIVFAGRGANLVYGEGGNDYLVGGEDNDYINGGPDTDTCDAGSLGFDTAEACEVLIGSFEVVI